MPKLSLSLLDAMLQCATALQIHNDILHAMLDSDDIDPQKVALQFIACKQLRDRGAWLCRMSQKSLEN